MFIEVRVSLVGCGVFGPVGHWLGGDRGGRGGPGSCCVGGPGPFASMFARVGHGFLLLLVWYWAAPAHARGGDCWLVYFLVWACRPARR